MWGEGKRGRKWRGRGSGGCAWREAEEKKGEKGSGEEKPRGGAVRA